MPLTTVQAESNPIFDNWSNLSFKRVLGNRVTGGINWLAPTWVGDHQRRLSAYRVLQSYIDNSSRWFLQNADVDRVADHREYGDAELIRDQILAALVGDDQQIMVEGADDFDPNNPDPGAADGQDQAKGKAAFDQQEWMRDWAWNLERMGLKIVETERNAVGLGDGVYTLGWDPEKGRPRLRVFDPGFYFPVLSDSNEDEYPEKVHIAWEMEDENERKDPILRIRRITWELKDLPDNGTKKYAYAPDVTSRKYCAMTDAIWTLDIGQAKKVDDFSGGSAEYKTFIRDGQEVEIKELDLGIDFIPVVHIPNTVSIAAHYGRSALASVLQILDDLCNADTDLQASADTTGKPPIALHGATMTTSPTYKAGEVWTVGDGNATMIDTSKALDALLKYVESLLSRLSVNSRVPESVLGRVEISGQLAGITLALSFGPLETMIREMRLVRDEKYPLLLKFMWRIALIGGMKDCPKEFAPAKLEFGRFLPSDQKAAADMVTTLLGQHAISRETAVLMLINAGFPIDSVNDEVRRIQEMDFDGADKLQAATGDDKAVRDYLGIKGPPPAPPAPPAQPAPTVQPPPGVTVPPGAQPPPPQPAGVGTNGNTGQ